MADLADIVKKFKIEGDFIEGGPYGTGHINDTYAGKFKKGSETVTYIHQRINHHIFLNPEALMENVERVTQHLRQKVIAAGGNPERETLNLIPAVDGKSFFRTPEGDYWRTYVFIKDAKTYDLVENLDMVYTSSAFGKFQKDLADLPGSRLHETIPDFHNTKKRFKDFNKARESDPKNRAASAKPEVEFVQKREKDTSILVDLMHAGKMPERITHNDTKFNNVMIDDTTGEAVCVIDLDTVMPGSALFDFGDSVRIGASTAVEDEQDLSKVSMDLDMFGRLAGGYLHTAGDFLTDVEKDLLAFSAKLMTFECGMRFLADHLEGDVYFTKVHRENHNLDRCRTQFKMVEDMENKMEEMEGIVRKYV
jgi:hypothetical protein